MPATQPGFTGKKPDSLGREQCYQRGSHVPCGTTPPSVPATNTPQLWQNLHLPNDRARAAAELQRRIAASRKQAVRYRGLYRRALTLLRRTGEDKYRRQVEMYRGSAIREQKKPAFYAGLLERIGGGSKALPRNGGKGWVTIGGSPCPRGRHCGGTPVEVDAAGKIDKGPPGLKGRPVPEKGDRGTDTPTVGPSPLKGSRGAGQSDDPALSSALPGTDSWRNTLQELFVSDIGGEPEDFDREGVGGLCTIATDVLQRKLKQAGIKTTVAVGAYAGDREADYGHFWLVGPNGEVIDPTEPQFDNNIPIGRISVYPKGSLGYTKYRADWEGESVDSEPVDGPVGIQAPAAPKSAPTPAYASGPAWEGTSPADAEVTYEGDSKKALGKLLGREVEGPEAAALVGVGKGAKVKVQVRRDGGCDIYAGDSDSEMEAVRSLKKDRYGKLVLINDYIHIGEGGKGVGSAMFARQVEAAAAQGVKEIHAYCTRTDPDPEFGDSQNGQNGYYTWPRLGYDGLLGDTKKSLPPKLRRANTIQELFSTPGGMAAWKEHGKSIGLSFDLKPGSRSRQVLDAYLKERAARKQKEG